MFAGWGFGLFLNLNCERSFLFGANANSFFDARDEDFAVTDLSSPSALDDHVHGLFDLLVGNDQLDFDFRQEIHRVLTATVNLGVSFLASEAFDFAHRHPLDPNFPERVFDLLQFEWFYDRFDFFHLVFGLTVWLKCTWATPMPSTFGIIAHV